MRVAIIGALGLMRVGAVGATVAGTTETPVSTLVHPILQRSE